MNQSDESILQGLVASSAPTVSRQEFRQLAQLFMRVFQWKQQIDQHIEQYFFTYLEHNLAPATLKSAIVLAVMDRYGVGRLELMGQGRPSAQGGPERRRYDDPDRQLRIAQLWLILLFREAMPELSMHEIAKVCPCATPRRYTDAGDLLAALRKNPQHDAHQEWVDLQWLVIEKGQAINAGDLDPILAELHSLN